MDLIEELLEKPYWVVDFLPEQVPADAPGQYFAVEAYYLEKERRKELQRKFKDILLKLGCYFDICISDDPEKGWEEDPEPAVLEERLSRIEAPWTLYILLEPGPCLIMAEAEETHMTVYDPSERLLKLLGPLSLSEGLFLWQPPGAGGRV